MAAASGLVIALAAVPLAPIHAQGQISQLSQDSKLIFQMASSNIMEVRLGQMAQQKASNASVKQFGQQMVTDHTNLENQLTGLVSKNNSNFQPAMSKENEAEVSRLEKLSGVLEEEPDVTEPASPRPLPRAHGAVRLERVTFSYRADRPVLPAHTS